MIAMVLSMAVLLTVTVKAFAEEGPTREEKAQMLKQAYKRIYGTLPESPQMTFKVPDPVPPEDSIWPKAEKKKVRVADICARHNMRKVARGKSWRCRK